MKIYYACSQINNFGDQISIWLAEKLSGKTFEFSEQPEFIISGSILKKADKDCHVFGAGFMNMGETTESENLHFVRGYLSAAMCRHNKRKPFVFEAGYCLREFFEDKKPDLEVGFIPHYIDWEASKDIHKEWYHIGICTGIENVVKEVLRCKKIITSSLHIMCLADLFERPCALVKISDKIVGDGFKYLDYYSFLGIKPVKLIPISEEKAIHAKVSAPANEFTKSKQSKYFIDELKNYLK